MNWLDVIKTKLASPAPVSANSHFKDRKIQRYMDRPLTINMTEETFINNCYIILARFEFG